jgi:hypothetical protein
VVTVATKARGDAMGMHAQERFLDHVLGLGDTAEHPVGDRERDRPQLVEQSLAIGHAAAQSKR